MPSEPDRVYLLQDLDSRHEHLLSELDALNRQIEATLASLRPAGTTAPTDAPPATAIKAFRPRSRTEQRVA